MSLLRTGAMISLLMIGLIAGVFFAWVCTTMWGLDATDPRVALQAMAAMNLSVQNALFFPVFFLTPLVLAFTAFLAWRQDLRLVASAFLLAAIIYFAGTFLPTALVSVPMNRAMEALPVPIEVDAAAAIWRNYSSDWQWWNQLRTVFAAVAFALTGWALLSIPATRN